MEESKLCLRQLLLVLDQFLINMPGYSMLSVSVFLGVLSRNPDHAQALADQYGAKVRTLDEVLAEVDMVHIFTPPSYRVEYVRQAVAAGKHIYIEKPMTISVADAREIVALASESQGKLMGRFLTVFALGIACFRGLSKTGVLEK
jgi:predicted dehydrogenase